MESEIIRLDYSIGVSHRPIRVFQSFHRFCACTVSVGHLKHFALHQTTNL